MQETMKAAVWAAFAVFVGVICLGLEPKTPTLKVLCSTN